MMELSKDTFSVYQSELKMSFVLFINRNLTNKVPVPVVQRVQLLRDGRDLLDAVLVGCQVRLEGLVLLLHRLQLEDLAVLVVLERQGENKESALRI